MQVSIVYLGATAWLLLVGVLADDIGVRRHRGVAASGATDDVEPLRSWSKDQKKVQLGTTNDSPNRDLGTASSGSSDSGNGSNAIFGVLANFGWNQFTSDDESFNSAATLICSAQFKGSKVPFHLIYGGGEPEEHLSVLKALGWKVEDHTSDLPFWKSNYKPIFNSSSAKEQGRRWIENNRVQNRHDGWLTYLKFHAWQATSYEHVMLVDMDVQFQSNPDGGFDKIGKDVDFLASFEKTPNGQYDGINTHLAILRPSYSTYFELVRKAQQGDYVPRTNTEQDIIEDMYTPSKVTTDMRHLFPHVHRDYTILRRKCVHAWTSQLLTKANPSCMDLRNMCKNNIFAD